MRPVPSWLWLITLTYAVLVVAVLVTGVWRKEYDWAWGGRYFPRNGRVGQFFAIGFVLIVAWCLLVFRAPVAAIGDPRHVGGYRPAQQKDLIN